MSNAKQLYQPDDLGIDDDKEKYREQWQLIRDEMMRTLAVEYAQHHAIGKDLQLLARFCNLTIDFDVSNICFRAQVYVGGGRRDEHATYDVHSDWAFLDAWIKGFASVLLQGYTALFSPQTIALEWNHKLGTESCVWWTLRQFSSFSDSAAMVEDGFKRLICTWRDCFGATTAIARTLQDARPNLRIILKPIAVIVDFSFDIKEMDGEVVKGSVVDIASPDRYRAGIESVSFQVCSYDDGRVQLQVAHGQGYHYRLKTLKK